MTTTLSYISFFITQRADSHAVGALHEARTASLFKHHRLCSAGVRDVDVAGLQLGERAAPGRAIEDGEALPY